MFLPNKTIKNKKSNYPPNKNVGQKQPQYGRDVKKFGLAHGFKTMCKAS